MRHFYFILLAQIISFFCYSQSLLPLEKTANWKDLGTFDIPVITDSVQVNINDYGGDPTGTNDNSAAIQSALSYLQSINKTGIIYFGAGTYLFNSTIKIITSNIILKGSGAATTKLRFIMGGKDDLIMIAGTLDTLTKYNIIGDGTMNQRKLRVADPNAFSIGDMVKLIETDTDLMTSTWAYGNVGQIMKVKSIVGDSIEFYSSLRTLYPASRNPYLVKATAVKNVGIICMDIVRGDATTNGGIFSNIEMDVTSNCWLSGIQSDSAYYAHVTMNNCYQNIIKGCYFTNAYDYGGDGRAYGIDCQNSSSENLIFDNIFKRLRHSMLLQAGANGNVFAYNYSRDTYWVQGAYPSDASGDIVFHGNYNFSNLFEGNIVQNLVIDNSHGINGPNNLFFRNRAENVGIFMSSGAGDSSAFIGNEVTTSAAKSATYFGLAFGQYALTGNGNFTYGNNIKGTFKPNNITSLAESSYYLSTKPLFFGNTAWPSIGYPITFNTGTIPAKTRYDAATYTVCTQANNTILALANITLTGKSVGIIDNLLWTSSATDAPTVYKIMMSLDGIYFDSIGQKVDAPTTRQMSYQFSYTLDSVLQKSNTFYYKILAYQKGGLAAISNVIAIRNWVDEDLLKTLLVTIYPNPTNSDASAIFYAEKDKTCSIKLIDQNGKQLLFNQIKTLNGWNKLKLSLATFPSGLYRLVINLSGMQKTYPIIKNNK